MTSEKAKIGVRIHFHDLPELVIEQIFSLIAPTRTRNIASQVCWLWKTLERKTRSSLSLRCTEVFNNTHSIRFPYFPSVSSLDLSNLSPYGRVSFQDPLLAGPILSRHLPSVISLTLYAHDPIAQFLSHWPNLKRIKLLRFRIPPSEPNTIVEFYLGPLFQNCTKIEEIDLSDFCCWTEDVIEAIKSNKPVAERLTSLNLMLGNASGGFQASDIDSITEVCQNLRQLIVPCVFNPRYPDFAINNETLVNLAANCPHLQTLHLVDNKPVNNHPNANYSMESNPSVITAANLEALLCSLPLLTDFSLNLSNPNLNVSLETLGYPRTSRIKNLKLGNFEGIWKGQRSNLDGIALCDGLEILSLKNCVYMSDENLVAIACGCARLTKIELNRCLSITELGIQTLAFKLRKTLKDFSLSYGTRISSRALVKALKPLQGQLQRLHMHCEWIEPESKEKMLDLLDKNNISYGLSEPDSWPNLCELSLRICADLKLIPLLHIGLDDCPNISSVTIKVVGDLGHKPRGCFNLNVLSKFENLSKLKLVLEMETGYPLDPPFGKPTICQDLWEKFYLIGINELLSLEELDYWPPKGMVPAQGSSSQEAVLFMQNKQRILSPDGASLITSCPNLRRLFIHGTTDEDSLMSFLTISALRDAQLREDYYLTLEDDGSAGMLYELCKRFELALNKRDAID
ncbi:F-box protein MAX2 [Rhynchospora pubera]|uniref:F-box protein MAX2 n=1 Tax=Rhynchospora pubera TaxID=906938 RepID=A0AAV8F5X2_9POAL|nr:F-box protein MAX2 [Rhynchospora pubera]